MNLNNGRRADEFDRLLDSGARTDDPVAAPLLSVATALRELPDVPAPRPEFRAALRQRLVAVATVQGVGATAETPLQRARAAGSTWRVQRRLSALAAGAAVVTGVAGVGVGASRAIPGDPFYGVKRATENAQLAVTTGTEARGKRHLEFARTRLHEVQALAGHSEGLAPVGNVGIVAGALAEGTTTPKLIASTLHDMDAQTRAGANDMFQAYRDSGSMEPLRSLDTFTHEQFDALRTLLPALPPAAQESARSSMALLSVVATDTVGLAALGGNQPGPTTPAGGATPPASTGSNSPTPATSSAPAQSSSPQPASGSTPPSTTAPGVTQLPKLSPPTLTSPLPQVSPIPSLLPTTSPLPTSLPSLPDIDGLLGH